jgi:hypothetical protein
VECEISSIVIIALPALLFADITERHGSRFLLAFISHSSSVIETAQRSRARLSRREKRTTVPIFARFNDDSPSSRLKRSRARLSRREKLAAVSTALVRLIYYDAGDAGEAMNKFE